MTVEPADTCWAVLPLPDRILPGSLLGFGSGSLARLSCLFMPAGMGGVASAASISSFL